MMDYRPEISLVKVVVFAHFLVYISTQKTRKPPTVKQLRVFAFYGARKTLFRL